MTVLISGVQLNDGKKNAAFIQWGEHPIPDHSGNQFVHDSSPT